MKHLIKKIPYAQSIFHSLKNTFALYANKAYSQEGEDLILKRIFEHQREGFYIDVGAHHPFRFSNTYLFYKRGWKGINIDAMPHSMKLFNTHRPRDINIETPIGKEGQILKYFSFNESALNTFKEEAITRILQNPHYQLIHTYTMETKPLNQILDKHLSPNQQIDFMSIDVEGLDLEVLETNDWIKYRPKILLVEALGGGGYGRNSLLSSLCLFISSKLQAFCQDIQYSLFPRQGVYK
ncbi:FkbM family methyltransferase [Helicobacter pametensis]|uniref:FkbM family methyltransferase n=1 Tax=Helicobacter pametensis TaxID=95149 RepID=UPI0004B6FBA3|nr:FkbM family methyltransferase [Helicobacter pametensis]